MKNFNEIVEESIKYLEDNQVCKKHHVCHTGKQAYMLDFYTYTGDVDKGRELIFELLDRVVDNGEGGKVFYPGHMDPMNMSQNVIDTGSVVDCISRFAYINESFFTEEEHKVIKSRLEVVVETYLFDASQNKQITNQRLWGLTGVASFSRYTGSVDKYKEGVIASISRAFEDMTVDGLFRYFPDPPAHALSYDAMSAYYQSRHIAFILYVMELMDIPEALFKEKLDCSTRALMSMYTSYGWKDMRMETKRWYWLSSYEVASNAFDSYVFCKSDLPGTGEVLNNSVYQIKSHFFDGHFNSHRGSKVNFQCPIFWTAHLAWLTRVDAIESYYAGVDSLHAFTFEFKGREVYTCTQGDERLLLMKGSTSPTLTSGIYTNGFPQTMRSLTFSFSTPRLFWFSLREAVNHILHAFRGGHIAEVYARTMLLFKNMMRIFSPFNHMKYGEIFKIKYKGNRVHVLVSPASYYGGHYGDKTSFEFSAGSPRAIDVTQPKEEAIARDFLYYFPSWSTERMLEIRSRNNIDVLSPEASFDSIIVRDIGLLEDAFSLLTEGGWLYFSVSSARIGRIYVSTLNAKKYSMYIAIPSASVPRFIVPSGDIVGFSHAARNIFAGRGMSRTLLFLVRMMPRFFAFALTCYGDKLFYVQK